MMVVEKGQPIVRLKQVDTKSNYKFKKCALIRVVNS